MIFNLPDALAGLTTLALTLSLLHGPVDLPAGKSAAPATLTDLACGPAKPLNTASCTVIQNAQVVPRRTYVNSQVFTYAKTHVGKQVGDGQCSALVVAPVAAAGGKPYSELGPTGPDADYVWGELITTITHAGGWPAAVEPGDIIQFRNVHLTMQTETVLRNGSSSTSTSTQTMSHHTAVLAAIRGNLIDVLQQNIGGILTDEPGTVWGKSFNVKQTLPGGVKVTTTYTLDGGTMWVYRPYS